MESVVKETMRDPESWLAEQGVDVISSGAEMCIVLSVCYAAILRARAYDVGFSGLIDAVCAEYGVGRYELWARMRRDLRPVFEAAEQPLPCMQLVSDLATATARRMAEPSDDDINAIRRVVQRVEAEGAAY